LQNNVVYDSVFTTVGLDEHHDNIPVPEKFHQLLEFSSKLLLDLTDNKDPFNENTWASLAPTPDNNSRTKCVHFQDQTGERRLSPEKEILKKVTFTKSLHAIVKELVKNLVSLTRLLEFSQNQIPHQVTMMTSSRTQD